MINETNQLLRLIVRALIVIAESRDSSCVDNDAVQRLRSDLYAIVQSPLPPFASGAADAQVAKPSVAKVPGQGTGGLTAVCQPPLADAPTTAKTGMAHGL